MSGSVLGKSRPPFEEPCCHGFKVLGDPGDGEVRDGHVPDQAEADPTAVEVQLLLSGQ